LSAAHFARIFVVARQRQQDLLVLGKALRAVREEQRLSVSELAAASGVPQARIAALERGDLDPRFEVLLELAAGLGVRPSELFVRAEELGDGD
jgi:transcriptional regulator with XRE-family HTH domain